jgi:hypothetical protein
VSDAFHMGGWGMYPTLALALITVGALAASVGALRIAQTVSPGGQPSEA